MQTRPPIGLPRSRFIGLADLRGWKIKTYGIAASARPRPELVGAARLLATDALPARPDIEDACGVGFLLVHDTPGCCLAAIDWWVRPDELRQRTFAAPPREPWALASLETPTIGRIPELAIIAHERQAWLRHVLERPAGPDIGAYLADIL